MENNFTRTMDNILCGESVRASKTGQSMYWSARASQRRASILLDKSMREETTSKSRLNRSYEKKVSNKSAQKQSTAQVSAKVISVPRQFRRQHCRRIAARPGREGRSRTRLAGRGPSPGTRAPRWRRPWARPRGPRSRTPSSLRTHNGTNAGSALKNRGTPARFSLA